LDVHASWEWDGFAISGVGCWKRRLGYMNDSRRASEGMVEIGIKDDLVDVLIQVVEQTRRETGLEPGRTCEIPYDK
jgi:hypothetical protein